MREIIAGGIDLESDEPVQVEVVYTIDAFSVGVREDQNGGASYIL
jgi:hypothetical protein